MTPAEVLAMRDRLGRELGETLGHERTIKLSRAIADWLIESGWVTNEPEEETKSAACTCARCWPKFYGFRVCGTCGNKRCPASQWHAYKCTGSNEPGQEPEMRDDD